MTTHLTINAGERASQTDARRNGARKADVRLSVADGLDKNDLLKAVTALREHISGNPWPRA